MAESLVVVLVHAQDVQALEPQRLAQRREGAHAPLQREAAGCQKPVAQSLVQQELWQRSEMVVQILLQKRSVVVLWMDCVHRRGGAETGTEARSQSHRGVWSRSWGAAARCAWCGRAWEGGWAGAPCVWDSDLTKHFKHKKPCLYFSRLLHFCGGGRPQQQQQRGAGVDAAARVP